MFDIFSCSNWTSEPNRDRPSDFPIRDGYGEYLAYPSSGTLTEAQFEQFREL